MNIRIYISFASISLLIFGLAQCSEGTVDSTWEAPEVIYPDDNPRSEASVDYGGALFFESLLSRDSTLSCQSCHLITEAFADHLNVGVGVDERMVTRNNPSLFNVGMHPYLMKDGKFPSLEAQVLGPINDHREFDLSREEAVERIGSMPLYQEMSMKAYGTEVTIESIQKAIANFQREIIAEKSPFDDFMRGDTSAISASAKNGWRLFQSDDLACASCHSGFDFSDYSFQNNGYFDTYSDSGRALMTGLASDVAKFKVPSLRNVELTYPYMHNGSVDSLSQIIRRYAEGGSQHQNQHPVLEGFEISTSEIQDLEDFLNSLTEKRYLD